MSPENRKPTIIAAWVVGGLVVLGVVYWIAVADSTQQAGLQPDAMPPATTEQSAVDPPATSQPAEEPGSITGSTTPSQ